MTDITDPGHGEPPPIIRILSEDPDAPILEDAETRGDALSDSMARLAQDPNTPEGEVPAPQGGETYASQQQKNSPASQQQKPPPPPHPFRDPAEFLQASRQDAVDMRDSIKAAMIGLRDRIDELLEENERIHAEHVASLDRLISWTRTTYTSCSDVNERVAAVEQTMKR